MKKVRLTSVRCPIRGWFSSHFSQLEILNLYVEIHCEYNLWYIYDTSKAVARSGHVSWLKTVQCYHFLSPFPSSTCNSQRPFPHFFSLRQISLGNFAFRQAAVSLPSHACQYVCVWVCFWVFDCVCVCLWLRLKRYWFFNQTEADFYQFVPANTPTKQIFLHAWVIA